jgi:hypothetical protein
MIGIGGDEVLTFVSTSLGIGVDRIDVWIISGLTVCSVGAV